MSTRRCWRSRLSARTGIIEPPRDDRPRREARGGVGEGRGDLSVTAGSLGTERLRPSPARRVREIEGVTFDPRRGEPVTLVGSARRCPSPRGGALPPPALLGGA